LENKLLLITPPFTQLNTPYPATAYLKGFLNTQNIASTQADLGIEVILALFSRQGLIKLFETIKNQSFDLSENAARIIALQQDYVQKIDSVILFLQGKNPNLAHAICQDDFLPEAQRFAQLDELDWAFGIMGNQDKAKHLATLFLEDLSDLIIETVDPHFGFSRYAERLGRSASSFDEMYQALQHDLTYIDEITLELLNQKILASNPDLIAFSVPFPGNLYASFRCAQFIKIHFPHIKTAMGGGFPNTELRSLSEARVFEFFDFITLDDGEAPIKNLLELINGKRLINNLKRTFVCVENKVKYINKSDTPDFKQIDLGTPDYSDLFLDKYISVIEIVNPMHRMWSDGRWNKLTMAHGCYWGKCTFCDISLDYIKIYEPATAKLLVDRMEEMMLQTGENGFHFVDEAAPPALMRELALEIIRRKLVVVWWTNIRFEKSFTSDLCKLLKNSGCIAVSGGLEVASDRLLKLIDKGVSVSQVAQVTRNFTESGIMVHAYLMYGFPTQTVQETIDSLEMVRQLFENGVLQSGFWHQFAMTAHSPIGLEPGKFDVIRENTEVGTFANNDLVHIDKTGIDHEMFSFGLKKSLYNYMHGIGFEITLNQWFDEKEMGVRLPKTKVPKDFIWNALNEDILGFTKPTAKIVWLGIPPTIEFFIKKKKGNEWEMAQLNFHSKKDTFSIQVEKETGIWLSEMLEKLSEQETKTWIFSEIKSNFKSTQSDDFELFWNSKPLLILRENGLLSL
jgi:radical SAM superfamily enzyme YgiQ (UPF0313 family)